MSPKGELVFDVGMHTGQDTAFYLAQGCNVVAIEADVTLVNQARTRFSRELRAGSLEILNLGIADREGIADFWICDEDSTWNSFDRAVASRDGQPHHSVTIPVVRFRSIVEKYSTPCYVKIDIEGNDIECVKSLAGLTPPRFISLESECLGDAGSDDVEVGLRTLKALRDLGYQKFKLIDQITLCSLSLPPSLGYRLDRFASSVLLKPPVARLKGAYRAASYLVMKNRLGRKHRWQFSFGSSGVWGSDTDGRWIGFDDAVRAYRYYRNKHFKNPDAKPYSFWCDWHAAL